MIRRRRSVLLEERAPLAQRIQVTLPGGDVFVGHVAQLRKVLPETAVLRVHYRIRPERRNHTAFPATLANLLVLNQWIEGCVCGRENLDLEAVEESARTELRRPQCLVDRLVVLVGVVSAQPVVEAELLL